MRNTLTLTATATILSATILTMATACVEYTPAPPKVTPPAETKEPAISKFEAVMGTVVAGNPATLSWIVTDAESITITKSGVDVYSTLTTFTGSFETAAINANTTYTLTAKNKEKTKSAEVTVVVMQVAVPTHASIQAFGSMPASVNALAPATLTWATTNAVSGKITSGSQTVVTIATADLAAGSFTVNVGTTTSYILEVIGGDLQPTERSALVNVNGMMGTGVSARDLFDANVATVLAQKCATCHANTSPGDGPDYMGTSPNPTTWYTRMEAAVTVIGASPFIQVRTPQDSPLVSKGEHTGPALTATERQTVEAWLLKEADERGLAPNPTDPPPGPTDFTPLNLREAIVRFTACMSLTDWEDTIGQNQASNVAYQNTAGNGACYACHSTGTGGAFLSQNSADTFDAHKDNSKYYVLKLVLSTVNPDGSFKDLVPAYRYRDKGQPPFGTPPHPSYNLTPDREQAVNDFVSRTLLKFRDFTRACP